MIRKKLVTLGLVGVMATSIAINNVTLVKAETLKANKNIIKSSSLKKNSDENKELDKAKRKARNHAENLLSMAEELYVKGNNDSIIKELMDSAKEKIDILHRLGGNTTEIIKQFENLDKKINKSIMRKPVNKENKKNEENIKELLKNTKNFISEKKLAEANSRILLATHYINKAEKEYGIDVSEFKKDIINLKIDNDKLYWELSKQNVKLKDEIYGDISKIDELLRNKEVDKCKELYENVKNKVKNFKYEDSTNAIEYVKKIKNKLKTKKQDIDKIDEELTRENKVVVPVKELVVQEKKEIVPVKELVVQEKKEIVPVKELVLQDKKEIVPVKEVIIKDKKETDAVKEVIVKEKEDIATSSKVVKDREVNNLIERNIPIKVTKFNKDEKNELVFRKNSITKQVNKSIETINRVNENKKSEIVETNSQVKVEENNLDNIKTKNDKEQSTISSEKKDQIELMKTEKSSISKGLIAGIIGTIVAIGAGIVLFSRKKF